MNISDSMSGKRARSAFFFQSLQVTYGFCSCQGAFIDGLCDLEHASGAVPCGVQSGKGSAGVRFYKDMVILNDQSQFSGDICAVCCAKATKRPDTGTLEPSSS